MVDFLRPNGTKVMRTIADYRQLNDALFHAGLRSGSQFEWEDTPNRLHFYIIDRAMSPSGVLSYVVGVRSIDGAGPQTRGVAATLATTGTINSGGGPFTVRVTNTGKDAPVPAGTHPSTVPAAFARDIYRVTVKVTGQGWNADVANALVALPFGASANVPVHAWKSAGAAATATVTVTITSESDPTKTAIVTASLR